MSHSFPTRRSSDLFVSLMDAPALLVEAFFGDNSEALKFKDLNKHAKLLIDTLC